MNLKITMYALLFALCIAGAGLTGCSRTSSPGKWGFIDKSGNLVIPYKLDDVCVDTYGGFDDPSFSYFLPKPFRNFSEGLCAARMGAKWGYIDKTGAEVIPAQFDSAGVFVDGLACVRQGRKVGYINKKGKVVIPITFDWFPWWDEKAPGNKELDFSKAMIQDLQFSDGLAVAFSGNHCGYIDNVGKFVIQPKYDRCSLFREHMAIVRKGDTLKCLNRTGTVIAVLPPHTLLYGEGLFVQSIGGEKCVYNDKAGRRAIHQVFKNAHIFSEGLAAVEPLVVNSSNPTWGWGYIDTSGKFVIVPSVRFEGDKAIPSGFYGEGNNPANQFVDGRAIVADLRTDPTTQQNLKGVMDKTGKWIVPPKYGHIAAYREGFARAYRDNQPVYLDKDGKEAIKPNALWANSFSEDLAAVMQP